MTRTGGAAALRDEVERDLAEADAVLSALLQPAYDPGLLAEVQALAGPVAQGPWRHGRRQPIDLQPSR